MARTGKTAAKATAEQEATEEENASVTMPEPPQEIIALVEVKPFDMAPLIAPPAIEESARKAEPEAKEANEQAA